MQEISERLGGVVSPVQVGARIKELLKMKNWLTAAEQDQEITLEMQRVLATLKARFQDNENLSLQLKVLKELGTRLDKRAAATQVDLNTYDANVGRQLGRVVDLALSYVKGALREKIDADEWDSLVLEAMGHARAEIVKNEVEA